MLVRLKPEPEPLSPDTEIADEPETGATVSGTPLLGAAMVTLPDAPSVTRAVPLVASSMIPEVDPEALSCVTVVLSVWVTKRPGLLVAPVMRLSNETAPVSPRTAIATPLLGAANTQFPVLFTDARSVVLLAHATVFAADEYMPLTGTVLPVTVTRSADRFDTPVSACEFHGMVVDGRPVPSRRMQLLNPLAMSSSWASSFEISIGELACSVDQLYSLENTPEPL